MKDKIIEILKGYEFTIMAGMAYKVVRDRDYANVADTIVTLIESEKDAYIEYPEENSIAIPFGVSLEDAIDIYVLSHLKALNNNRTLSAKILKITMKALRERITKTKVLTKLEKSNLSKLCSLCRSGHNLVVHHIVPKEIGGDDSKENFIVVCRKCHVKIHRLLQSVVNHLNGK